MDSQQGKNAEKNEVEDITPFVVMHGKNCMSARYANVATYPNIRPAYSKCSEQHRRIWLADVVEEIGCPSPCSILKDGKSLDERKQSSNTHTQRNHGFGSNKNQTDANFQEEDVKLDYRELTPYDVMRMENCKSNRFVNRETYPSIRPPLSKCNDQQTKTWLADAVETIGCARPFRSVKGDDLMNAWKQSPNKHTLSCYGLGSDKYLKDAMKFDRVLNKCLDKVNGVERCKVPKKLKNIVKCEKNRPKPMGTFVLNRNELKYTINNWPTVMKKTSAINAKTAYFCPDPKDPENPFKEVEPVFPLQLALDMVKPVQPPNHGRRRKYMYCDRQCGIPENECTAYEWRRYKQNPRPYDAAFKSELARMKCPKEPEPKNFDEVYAQLVSCFEKNITENADCDAYGKCCRPPSERNTIQGCGEELIFGPFACTCGSRKVGNGKD